MNARYAAFIDEQDEASFDAQTPPLTAAQAQELRLRNPSISPWRVVAAQAVAGLVCVGVARAFAPNAAAAWSALYGAAATVIPAALLARGMTRGTTSPVAAAAGFMFWETLKMAAAIAMLVIAARVVPNLSWPALLATMFVCIKVNWVALLWRAPATHNKGMRQHGS